MQSKSYLPDLGTNGSAAGSKSATAIGVGARAAASRELHDFLADIEDLIKEASSLTGDELTRARAQLNERVGAVKESIQDMGGSLVERARKTVSATNDYAHEDPWKAIGAGAAIGMLLGFLLARRG